VKQVSPALKALIEGGRFVQGEGLPGAFVPFDLYTIATTGGLVLLYTTADFPIAAPSEAIFSAPSVYGPGNVWFPGIVWTPVPIDMKETKATAHWKIGLDADSWTVKIAPRSAAQSGGILPVDLIGSQPWLAAAAAGVLDNADCIVSRAYFASVPTYPTAPGGAVPVGTMIMFRGYLGEVDLTTTAAVLTINDYRQVFQKQMPRNLYLAQCKNIFGDNRCTVSLALYTKTGAASAASTPAMIIAASAVPAPGGSGTYALGKLTMTGGLNKGFTRVVRAWDGGVTFGLLTPFPYPIAAGDAFSVSAGCPRTMAACTSFGNLPNFRGEPFTPVPEISLG
jgi:uncharacterized phage protein (TIGR02218 family)